jgi:hypothetical protein
MRSFGSFVATLSRVHGFERDRDLVHLAFAEQADRQGFSWPRTQQNPCDDADETSSPLIADDVPAQAWRNQLMGKKWARQASIEPASAKSLHGRGLKRILPHAFVPRFAVKAAAAV